MVQELLDISTGVVYRRSGDGWQEALQGASAADMLSYLGGVARSGIGNQIWEGSATVGATISVPRVSEYDVFEWYNAQSEAGIAIRGAYGGGSGTIIFGISANAVNSNVWVNALSMEQIGTGQLKIIGMAAQMGTTTGSDLVLKGLRGIL